MQMPVGILTLSTATPPELLDLHDDPQGFSDYVAGVIARVPGVELLGLFFDVGAEKAYALVEGLDDYRDVKAVSRILGAVGFLKLVRAPQAAEAIDRERDYRGGSSA
jgi:hypothetical protein